MYKSVISWVNDSNFNLRTLFNKINKLYYNLGLTRKQNKWYRPTINEPEVIWVATTYISMIEEKSDINDIFNFILNKFPENQNGRTMNNILGNIRQYNKIQNDITQIKKSISISEQVLQVNMEEDVPLNSVEHISSRLQQLQGILNDYLNYFKTINNGERVLDDTFWNEIETCLKRMTTRRNRPRLSFVNQY